MFSILMACFLPGSDLSKDFLTSAGQLEKSLLACHDWPESSVTEKGFTPGGKQG
jgi:hypothetical protein